MGHLLGRNPPYGANINFYVKEAPDKPVEITVLDAGGETVRTLSKEADAGINRLWWNLRYESSERAKLRTPPPGKPWVPLGKDGTRPVVTWDLDLWRGQLGPIAPPGTYTVRVKVGDRELAADLEVIKDPHSAGSETDIQQQVALSLEIRDNLNEVVDMINRIEWIRRQLLDLETMFAGDENTQSVLEAAGEIGDSAITVEGKLFDVTMTGAREDAFRGPMKLYGRLSALGSDLSGFGADFPPTQQQLEVHRVLTQRLAEAREEFKVLMEQQVPAFNEQLREKGIGGIAIR
jgi:hypothetical protein